MAAVIDTARAQDGVVVVSGYGVHVSVHHGQLEVVDGFPDERRSLRLHRATSKLKRFVVLGHTGTISLEALRWLHDVGAAFVHIDADGSVLSLSAPVGRDDARLRRAQALAPLTGLGLVIAKDLIRRKLEGQRQLLNSMPEVESALATITTALENLEAARDVNELRVLEAASAAAYWSAWSSIGMRFAQDDLAKVPEHWLQFDGRSSPITGSPRRAADPINALLNYIYALLEAECRIALLALGLDPGMGVLHFDQRGRDSLALDLMEAARPIADALVLNLVGSRTFAAREFFETRTGDCRLVSPLPEHLASLIPGLRRSVAPVAESLARALAGSIHSASTRASGESAPVLGRSVIRELPTPLTGTNRSSGRAERSARPTSSGRAVPRVCERCAAGLETPGRQYCDACLGELRNEIRGEMATRGPAALARLRAAGEDPTATPEARAKMKASRQLQRDLDEAWDRQQAEAPSPEVFKREVLVGLEAVPLGALMRATGLSLRQCSRIRRGESLPHPRHWDGLRALAGVGAV